MSTESIQLVGCSNQLCCIGHLSTRNFIAESIIRIVVDNSILTNHEISIPQLQMIVNKLLRQQSTRISIRGVSRARHHFVSLPCTDCHVRLRPAVIQNWKITTTGESSPFRFNSSQRRGILGLKEAGSSSPRDRDNRKKQINSPTNDDEPIEFNLSEIKALEAKIKEVEFCVEAVEYRLLNETGAISPQALLKVPMYNGYTPKGLQKERGQLKEKLWHLRGEGLHLREEKRQLREEKLICYKTQGKPSYLTCLERILFFKLSSRRIILRRLIII